MNALLAALNRLYGGMLRLYPQHFQIEFGAEMQAVFGWLSDHAASRGLGSLAVMFMKEIKDLPGAALREHWRIRKESQMQTDPKIAEPAVPWWALAAVACFFILPGVMELLSFLFTGKNQVLMVAANAILLLVILGPIGVALVTRLPRWSLVYLGVILGGVGIYGVLMGLGSIIQPAMLRMESVLSPHNLISRLEWQWMGQAMFWLSIFLAFGLFIGFSLLVPPFRPLFHRLWSDWTQISYLFYGAALLVFFIDFDEYRYDTLYRLGCLAALAAGAWGYLRASTAGRRTLALVAGITACMAIMGIGKFFLVPLQDWPYWFSIHPPADERWFESLRSIATWFWCALAVGLPGLLQMRRKPPHPEPLEALQTA